MSFCGFGHHVHALLHVSGCNDSFVVCGVEKSKLVSTQNIGTGRRRQNCPKGNSSQTRPSGYSSWQSVEHDHCLQGNFLAGALGSWNPAPKLIFTIHCYSVLARPNVCIYIYVFFQICQWLPHVAQPPGGKRWQCTPGMRDIGTPLSESWKWLEPLMMMMMMKMKMKMMTTMMIFFLNLFAFQL